MPNILLTSVGRRVELVRAFRAAYEKCHYTGQIVGTDIDWLAPALHFVDRPVLVPQCRSAEYIPALVEVCQSEQIDLVLPLIDPDIPVLSAHRGRFASTGARLAVVSESAAQIAGDKWDAYRFFSSLDLAVPQSWLPETVPDSGLAYPVFIKPRGGSAAENTFRVDDGNELDFLLKRITSPIIQELLPGPEITCDVLTDLAGEPLAVVQRQRISVRGGEAIKSRTVHVPGLDEACRQVARKLPAIGPITVQCMMKGNLPCFIEINARLGGGLPLAIAAGLDVPAALLAMAAGDDPQPHIQPYRLGVTMTRFDESIFLNDDDWERTKGRNLRS